MRQRHFQSKNLTGASQAISHISEINTPVLSPKLAMLSLQQGGCLLPETVCQTSVAVHFEEAKQPALFFQRDLLGIKKKKSRREHKSAVYKKYRKQVYWKQDFLLQKSR